MIEVFSKLSLVYFGKFHYPATSEVSRHLLNTFGDEGLLPSILQANTGRSIANRVSLANNDQSFRMIFADERIDFIVSGGASAHLDFIKEIDRSIELLDRLKSDETYSRVALVVEKIIEAPSIDSLSSIKRLMSPSSSPEAIEWSSRWVTNHDSEFGKVAFITEVGKVLGQKFQPNQPVVTFDAIQALFDINTPNTLTLNSSKCSELLKSFELILRQPLSEFMGSIK